MARTRLSKKRTSPGESRQAINKEGQIKTNLNKEGQIKTNLNKEGQIKTNLNKEGRIKTNLNKEGRIKTNLNKEGQIKTNLNKEGQIKTNLGNTNTTREDVSTQLSSPHLDQQYQCGACKEPITWEPKERCNTWYHIDYKHIEEDMYDERNMTGSV